MGPDAASAAGERGIRARDLLLLRGGREVLRGGALEVRPGVVTALLAPSGAGKSSLLRCCTRLLEPERGTVALDGVPVTALDPRALRRRVGLVAQAPVMLPGTVAENLHHGLEELPGPRRDAALDRAGLAAAFAGRAAAGLSGGERARVALARALVRDPEVLLLDEPTSALDETLVGHLAAVLRELAADGLAVCAATHDRGFVDALGARAVDLHGAPA